VIFAGPAVNLVLGFVLLLAYYSLIGAHDPAQARGLGTISKGFPAQGVLHVHDTLVAVNGRRGTVDQLVRQVTADRCFQQPPVDRCRGAKPLRVTVDRGGRELTYTLTPLYDAAQHPPKMRLGFGFDPNSGPRRRVAFGSATNAATKALWNITKAEVSIPAKIVDPSQRKQIHGIVGTYESTRQTILHDAGDVLGIMAVISLALAIVNLFPFLPLDGGHIFWALVEKIRRRPVSLATMERSGYVGFALVIMLFAIGLTNDIGVLNGKGFGPPP
jgi:regulator of sigma E protease